MLIIGIIVIGTMLALLPHLVWLVARLAGMAGHFRVVYAPFGWTAMGLVVVWTMLALYGNVFGRFRHEVKHVQLSFSTLPASFDGLRIVHISDLHLDGWEGHEAELQQCVEEVNALQPDIICFTGDLISFSPEELKPFLPILRQLRTTGYNRIFSILGNHDYMPYTRSFSDSQRQQALEELIRLERQELGWTLLLNESAVIHRDGDSIAILGCENQSVGAHAVVQRGDLSKTMKGSENAFSILLTHDPSQWRKEVVPQTDIPLTLSGHTHAMQLRMQGFTPSKWVYPECDGLYTDGSQRLYVNIGLGGTLPWRIGATPEITLLTLRRD